MWEARRWWCCVALALIAANVGGSVEGRAHRILVDTDVGTDDLFALLYLLKLNTSQFKLEVLAPPHQSPSVTRKSPSVTRKSPDGTRLKRIDVLQQFQRPRPLLNEVVHFKSAEAP
ncbi:uncharacterized protein LOC114915676 [Cajanus cajan]|uniref:uncharacterized protein LOC114915676 n=1 Tax=Cajanus cajan TaxID=3821 RepID=UPI0010FADDF8|nr:uncharacterized protein LOC114915676 [Cajanus cajan]